MTTVTKVNPVEAFMKKVREDGQLRSQIEMLAKQEKNQAIQQLVSIANKMNYKFNAKQYEECARAQWARNANANCEMTNEQLILVACGRC